MISIYQMPSKNKNLNNKDYYSIVNSWITHIQNSFVQFHLDSSDSIPSEDDIFIIVEYSINGGIEWTTFEVIPLNGPSSQQLLQVPLPSRTHSLAARLKWSQLGGRNQNLHTIWSIDEVL